MNNARPVEGFIRPKNAKRISRIEGFGYKLTGPIDCDSIIPVRFCIRPTTDVLKKNCLTAVDPLFPQKARRGLIILAESGFGRGSANENAVRALMLCGVKAVIAEGMFRIFYRNAVNLGLPALICPEMVANSNTDDRLAIDLIKGVCLNITKGLEYPFRPQTKIGIDILRHKGLINYLRTQSPKTDKPIKNLPEI